jgi:Predicted ATPase of the ABC class
MKDKLEFFNILKEIDGREYGDLVRLMGDYDFNRYVVKIGHVPHNTEDTGLSVVVRITHAVAGFPEEVLASPIRRTALEDLLARKLSAAIGNQATFDANGVARRRIISPRPGQKILPRSTVQITDDFTDVRLNVLIPLQRGRLDGMSFQTVFFDDLPMIVQESLLYCNMNPAEVNGFVGLMEDADHIRQSLASRGLIGFVGSGSMLARLSGADLPDYEAESSVAVDPSIQITFDTPHHGPVNGFGISSGVTLILGDAFSGRVELMQAIAAGIYNHIPGDGREYVVTMPDSVYIAAEPGRSVQRVDIGSILSENDYSSPSANSCHSQAASLIEALEAGARVIILDESDSCPGFLGTDERIQALIGNSDPLASLASRVKQLTQELGVSTVVAGYAAVSSFIPVADTVLAIRDGVITDITREAKATLSAIPVPQAPTYDFTHLIETARWVIPSSIDASVGRLDGVIGVDESGAINFGRYVIRLGNTHQVADVQQTLTLGLIIDYARQRYLDKARPMRELLDLVERDLSTEGLEQVTRELRGDLARPRRYEIAAALNRLPSLRVSRAAL